MFTENHSLIPKSSLRCGRFEKVMQYRSFDIFKIGNDGKLQFKMGKLVLETNEKLQLGETTYVYDLKSKHIDLSMSIIGYYNTVNGLIVTVMYDGGDEKVIVELCNEAFLWEKTSENNIIIYI